MGKFYSKPLTYGIALNELGSEVVHRYVGQEPSGRMFNELILDYNSKFFTNYITLTALCFLYGQKIGSKRSITCDL